MSFIDGILLTIVNTVVCLGLPKLLSVISAMKTKNIVSAQPTMESQDTRANIPSYVDVVS
ncbi:hypothetical protein [Anabaena sp. UHCC 0399]|uniref:hypothetical protein n=1 Tax=Anabaena sp. UHCC 0399 TaxID=3110238 RepID=UPI0016892AD7|nr:hypothetical protein [Anabaena sp. UHCC 0399]MBD2362855.1 hypothetical protein [Anabaena minutissima FACHB-250]MEA5568217.1 hypothetical protein [Anabaena sp. UHCC 0399]